MMRSIKKRSGSRAFESGRKFNTGNVNCQNIDTIFIHRYKSRMRIIKTIIITFMIISLIGCSLKNQMPNINSGLNSTSALVSTENPTLIPSPSLTETSTLESIFPSNNQIKLSKADHFLRNGDYDSALYEYLQGTRETTDQGLVSESYWGLCRVEFLRDNFDQSLEYIEELQTKFPGSSAAKRSFFLQGLNYDRLKLYSKAADSYLAYLQENPGIIDSYVHEARGDSLSYAKYYQEALSEYEASITSGGSSETLEVKIGKMNRMLENFSQSIEIYQDIFSKTSDEYLKAQMDFLIGEIYYAQGLFENAYPYFMDAVINYPVAYDSYSALITLVNDGIEVDDYYRGLVDYFAGQYGLSMAAFDRFINQHPDHDGTVLHYKALLFRSLGDYQMAIDQWTTLIDDYPDNIYWDSAWDERAYTLWGYLDDYQGASQSLLDYVNTYPIKPNAPFYLNTAARILERGGFLESANTEWVRLSNDYPESELVQDALFNSGIVLYRLGEYGRALVSFQKNLIFSNSESIQARTYLWIGKTQEVLGDSESAIKSYQLAAGLDPSDYYSHRANAILTNMDGFASSDGYDFSIDIFQERIEAETWLRITFNLDQSTILSGLGDLALQENIVRGTEFWKLGLFDEATNEFNNLIILLKDRPVDCYRIANYIQELGFYRLAINAYRQVLVSAGMETYTQMLNAPEFFLHMNYGPYFVDLINPNAQIYDMDPALIMSIILQESGFDGYIQSSAGAIGLMQIIPSTGETISNGINWPIEYKETDLSRPFVNIRLGSAYLSMNRSYFDGEIISTLAAYNAGPGNVSIWRELAGSDPDLFLEVIRYPETRNYIENIYEIFQVYKTLYKN